MNHSASLIPVLFLLMLINNFLTQNNNINPDQSLKDDPHQIYIFEKYEMTIISIADTFDFTFIPKNAESIDSVAAKGNYKILINGSFFDGTRLAAEHAGWLRLFGKTYSPINSVFSQQLTVRIRLGSVIHYSIKDDCQLTRIVRYNPGEKNAKLVS